MEINIFAYYIFKDKNVVLLGALETSKCSVVRMAVVPFLSKCKLHVLETELHSFCISLPSNKE